MSDSFLLNAYSHLKSSNSDSSPSSGEVRFDPRTGRLYTYLSGQWLEVGDRAIEQPLKKITLLSGNLAPYISY